MKLRDNEIGYNKSLIMQLILLMIESIVFGVVKL